MGALSLGPSQGVHLLVLTFVCGICLRELSLLQVPPVHVQLSLLATPSLPHHHFEIPFPGFFGPHQCFVVTQAPVRTSLILTAPTPWVSTLIPTAPLPCLYLVDKLLPCAPRLCIQFFELLCPEVRPLHALPKLLLILHPASVNRSAIHHPEIWALPLLPPCPTP